MIRTAILAGILLVMLSMAYTHQGVTPFIQQAALLEQPQVKAAAHAAKTLAKQAAPATAEEPQPASQPEPVKTAIKEEPSQPAPQPAAVAAPAPPLSLLPPAAPVQAQVTAVEPAPRDLTPLIPQAPGATAEAKPAPAEAALPKIDEMPTIAVARRPVMMPRDLPLPGEQSVADASPAMTASETTAKPSQPAPKFMTPQERSRDLYRLAREMEETFINKLAP